MTKEERLHQIFGDIDDDLVADATHKPTHKRIWMPLIAAATCVALTVGLWQGGVFDPATPPVTEPGEEPSATEPSEDSTATTTPTTTKSKLLITADAPDRSDSSEMIDAEIEWPTKENAFTPLLKEKMEQYQDANATFAVIVQLDVPYARYEEFKKRYSESNEELRRLGDELWAAYNDYVDTWIVHSDHIKLDVNPYPEKEAKYYTLRDQYLKLLNETYGNVEDIEDELLRGRIEEVLIYQEYHDARVKEHTYKTTGATEEEIQAAASFASELEDKAYIYANEYMDKVEKAREEYCASVIAEQYETLADVCETPPKEFSSGNVEGYYAELTAEQINALAEKEGYWFRLAMADGIDRFEPNYDAEEIWAENA